MTTVWGPPWGSEQGIDDDVYIRRVRELLEDYPILANEQANGNGSSTFFQLQKTRVNDDKFLQVTVGGSAIPVVADRSTVTSGHCWIDFDSGLLIFGTAPATGANNVVIQHTRVRWRDSVILEALKDGLRNLYPQIFKKAVDTSITMQVNQWDYTLPSSFWDPRVRITSYAIQEIPPSVNRPVPISGAFQRGLRTITIPTSQRYTPGAVLYLEYEAPYRSLGDLEPQAQGLPIWYAAGMLLGFSEAKRTRQDSQMVNADQAANPAGASTNAGGWYMSQYRQLLNDLAMTHGMPRMSTTYER